MNAPALRILHTEASLGWGGQEIRILTEAAEFADNGHEVHLVCDPDSDIFAAAPDYGISRTAIPMKKKTLAGLRTMRGFFSEWKPDVVNTHSSIDHWLAATARLRHRQAPAIVRTRHISAPVSRGLATRWLYNRGCEFLMATSQAIVDTLTGDGFLPRERAAAVPTGIDTEHFRTGGRHAARSSLGLPDDAFVFAIVATLRSWKGHAHLVEALRLVEDTGAMLLIVGDGPQEENLRNQIAGAGLENRIVLTGRRADVLPCLQAADAFVLPSYANEGVPQAMLQAMACELPIVACPVGGIPELTEGLGAVRFAEPKNPESLARALKAAVESPPGAAACAALRERVTQGFSRRIMYENALAAFEAARSNLRSSRDRRS